MMPREYDLIPIMKKVENTWRDKAIQFEISGCRVLWHEDRTGAKMWLLLFKIKSDAIFDLRKDLGLPLDPDFVPHITILENEIY